MHVIPLFALVRRACMIRSFTNHAVLPGLQSVDRREDYAERHGRKKRSTD